VKPSRSLSITLIEGDLGCRQYQGRVWVDAFWGVNDLKWLPVRRVGDHHGHPGELISQSWPWSEASVELQASRLAWPSP